MWVLVTPLKYLMNKNLEFEPRLQQKPIVVFGLTIKSNYHC